jgi:GNAT superfamily N-acetyltransferase
MEHYIDTTTQEELEGVFNIMDEYKKKNKLRYPSTSSWSHLEVGLYEWRIEKNWDKPDRHIRVVRKKDNNQIMGAVFWSNTSRGVKHSCWRHITILEEFRGHGLSYSLYNYMYRHTIEQGITRVRAFFDKNSIHFNHKYGLRSIGFNKSNQPFMYLPLFNVKEIKYLGKKYDEIGFEKCIEIVKPEVEQQMNKIIQKGGRWLTQEEIQEIWNS